MITIDLRLNTILELKYTDPVFHSVVCILFIHFVERMHNCVIKT
jgi:hypothetical protein